MSFNQIHQTLSVQEIQINPHLWLIIDVCWLSSQIDNASLLKFHPHQSIPIGDTPHAPRQSVRRSSGRFNSSWYWISTCCASHVELVVLRVCKTSFRCLDEERRSIRLHVSTSAWSPLLHVQGISLLNWFSIVFLSIVWHVITHCITCCHSMESSYPRMGVQ